MLKLRETQCPPIVHTRCPALRPMKNRCGGQPYLSGITLAGCGSAIFNSGGPLGPPLTRTWHSLSSYAAGTIRFFGNSLGAFPGVKAEAFFGGVLVATTVIVVQDFDLTFEFDPDVANRVEVVMTGTTPIGNTWTYILECPT